jgi:hypothetical protein
VPVSGWVIRVEHVTGHLLQVREEDFEARLLVGHGPGLFRAPHVEGEDLNIEPSRRFSRLSPREELEAEIV